MQRRRLDQNRTQVQVARVAGVSVRSLNRLEQGVPTSLETGLRVLLALDADPEFALRVPAVPPHPLGFVRQRIEERGPRRRARPHVRDPWPWWRLGWPGRRR